MKRQLMTLAAMVVFAASSLGQGQVTLGNNASSLIIDSRTGAASATGSLLFQLYYAVGSSQPEASLVPVGPNVNHNASFAGRIANTVIDVTPSAPATACTFQVWAWQSSFANYAAAAAGNGVVGKSAVFNATTSAGGSPPPLPTALAGLYPGFTVAPIIPEPSTFVLAGLGIASLLLFRRRK